MSDETVMGAVDRELSDAGLHAVTPGSVERLMAEVERLRAELHEAQDDARFRAEAEAASKADRAEVERLRARINDLMLGDNATIDRLRTERDEARAEVERLEEIVAVQAARENTLRDVRLMLRQEVERLRAERDRAIAERDQVMRGCRENQDRLRDEIAKVRRLRAERDKVRRWLRQWRDAEWRPATREHERLDEWMGDGDQYGGLT